MFLGALGGRLARVSRQRTGDQLARQ
jgi:hypothetical protein